jgi:predicted nucleotide-binding protein
MESFDVNALSYGNTGVLTALNADIDRNIERAFGSNTTDAARYAAVSSNRPLHVLAVNGRPTDDTIRRNVASDLASHIPLLQQAIKALEDDLADMEEMSGSTVNPSSPPSRAPNNKVFIVHGHDDGAKEQVARFLERLGIEAVILHEQANRGRTIIEKIEHFSDVDFAVVLLTPDDIGAQKDATPVPRARQNVVLELGYFIGKLGRSQVAAFRKGDVEIPSDYLGVVWQPFDSGWQVALAQELQAGGFKIEWNLIMGRG